MESIIYKILGEEEINIDMFEKFNRHQDVTKCYRKIDGEWVLKDIAFIEEWDKEDYKDIVTGLRKTSRTGGKVIVAMKDDFILGFVSIENEFLGKDKNYIQLSELYVSEESRGKGIGKELFKKACLEAIKMNGEKLYISAHSSEESQKFYRGIGCIEAKEYNEKLTELEPCDCQMEYELEIS